MRSTEQLPAAIEEEISRGLLLWFAEGFGLKEGENLFYAPTSNKALQAQQQKLKAQGGTLTYPLVFLKISDVNRAVQTTGYNPRALARHGVFVRTDDKDRMFVRKLHPMRVDWTFDVLYVVESHEDAMTFVSLWMTLGQENRLNFTINYYGTAFDIAVRLADSVTVPEKETSVDEQIQAYEFQTSLVVEGYMTARHPDNDSDIPLVQNISVAAQPTVDVQELKTNSRVLNAALVRS